MINSQAWLPFADAGTHFDTLHGQHPHYVAVCTTSEGADWKQRVYAHDTARSMAGNLAADHECYISQSGLKTSRNRRRVSDVASLNAHWVDLDIYNTPHVNRSANEMLALMQKQHTWLPAPTMIVSSGRGYHFEWVFIEHVGADSLPIWQATQDTLTDMLKPLGADPAVRDAARVLRLVGSRNEKNGALVTAQIDTGGGVDFKKFARLVKKHKPAAPTKDNPARTHQPVTARTNTQKAPRVYSTKDAANRARISDYSLARARMIDCVTLAELRGAPLTDFRSRLLFVYGVAGAWYWSSNDHAIYELNQFSQDYFADHDSYGAQRCFTVLERMKKASRGETQEWLGRSVDPRYKLTNKYIIEKLLEITPAEQTHMQTIFSKEEKARRRSERERRIRAAEGKRTQYLAKQEEITQGRAQQALEHKNKGLKQVEIARLMGISQPMVSRLLNS